MMDNRKLGWLGASIAAGILPTFQMTFASETLASSWNSAGLADPTDGHLAGEFSCALRSDPPITRSERLAKNRIRMTGVN